MARKSAAGRKKGGEADPADRASLVLAAALKLAAKRPWSAIALADIAEEAGLSLADLYVLYPSREAVVGAVVRRIDRGVLESVAKDRPEGGVRDRLFDVIMRRFDAMQGDREGLRSILRGTACDPLSAAHGALRLRRSMQAMLEAAGIPTGGISGALRVKGLSALYLWTLRTWLTDETADRAKTMAALDGGLKQAEKWLARGRSFCPGKTVGNNLSV